MTHKQLQVDRFLRESNAIEGVYDEGALQQARTAWGYLINEDTLSPSVILKTHKILMIGQPLQPYERGYFRDVNVFVGNKPCLSPKLVREFTEAWCEATMKLAAVLNPIALHIAYEKIHPFVDGNGRTGRMFLNWTRLKLTNEDLLIIHESKKADYYKWFS